MEFSAEVFNLANQKNFKTINNTVGPMALSSLPRPAAGIGGVSPRKPFAFTSAYDPRQFQLGPKVRYLLPAPVVLESTQDRGQGKKRPL